MRVDGKTIANGILDILTTTVSHSHIQLNKPTLSVIRVGADPGSISFIKQKQKACDAIGATLIETCINSEAPLDILEHAIQKSNGDTSIHGVIVQRPVPLLYAQSILQTVSPAKDVDGFLPNSAFQAPVARAVITILGHIHQDILLKQLIDISFMDWLRRQSIAIIGRGETAGAPLAKLLEHYGCATSIVHSQTDQPDSITRNADIIISCVGKKRIITKRNSKRGSILISVGLWRDHEGNLHGDYDEADIADHASFYTPTPGGVGPVNVASLMQNLVDACIMKHGGTS